MATRKKPAKPAIDDGDDDAGGNAAGEAAETLPLDGFERVRAAFGQEHEPLKMKVMKVERDGTEGVLETFEWNPDVHGEDFLRQRYGPGKYRLRFINARHRSVTSVTVTISELPEDAGKSLSSSSGGFDPLPYFMRQAEQSREQFNQMVLAMLAAKEGGSGGGGGSEALIAMVKAQADTQSAILQQLLQRSPASTNGVESVLKALETGMSVVSDLKADSEGGWVSAIRSVAKELGPALTELMQRQQQQNQQRQQQQQQSYPQNPPAGSLPETTTPAQPTQLSADDAMRGILARYAPVALQAAQANRVPTDFAAELLDSVGVSFHYMFDSVTAGDLVSLQPELGGVKWKNPETGVERPWVDEVIDLLHTRDWPDDEPESGSAPGQ